MVGVRSARVTVWWLVGGAGGGGVRWTGAVCANLTTFAVGSDVAVFLAFVAADRFANVFPDCNHLAFNVDPLAE